MSEIEITNLREIVVERLEVLDELLLGWTTLHPRQVRVFFVDDENRKYLMSRESFEVNLVDGKVSLEINFAQGVKLYGGSRYQNHLFNARERKKL